MSRFFAVTTAILLVLGSCVVESKRQKLRVIPQHQQQEEPQAQGTDHVQLSSGGYDGGYSQNSGNKYTSGSELTSLAHSSALQAKSAAQSQQSAGIQAALGAKTGFAQAALGAAATAQVALVAKQVIVQNLEQQLHDAEHQLQSEITQFHQNEQAAQAAQQAANQAQQQSSAATAASAAAQAYVQHAQQAAAAAANAAASQHEMIQDAKQKIAQLNHKLTVAYGQLQETQSSAHKAASSAQIAQSNAAAVAQAVVAENQIGHQQQENSYHH